MHSSALSSPRGAQATTGSPRAMAQQGDITAIGSLPCPAPSPASDSLCFPLFPLLWMATGHAPHTSRKGILGQPQQCSGKATNNLCLTQQKLLLVMKTMSWVGCGIQVPSRVMGHIPWAAPWPLGPTLQPWEGSVCAVVVLKAKSLLLTPLELSFSSRALKNIPDF